MVVASYFISWLWLGAGTFFYNLVLQAAGGGNHTGLGFILSKKSFTGFVIGFNNGCTGFTLFFHFFGLFFLQVIVYAGGHLLFCKQWFISVYIVNGLGKQCCINICNALLFVKTGQAHTN